jgi:hypothetical protein
MQQAHGYGTSMVQVRYKHVCGGFSTWTEGVTHPCKGFHVPLAFAAELLCIHDTVGPNAWCAVGYLWPIFVMTGIFTAAVHVSGFSLYCKLCTLFLTSDLWGIIHLETLNVRHIHGASGTITIHVCLVFGTPLATHGFHSQRFKNYVHVWIE